MNPCAFGTTDPLYIQYHDNVWGKPLYDSQQLFELLALESQHAGLSWLTILKKKDAYKEAFFQFDPYNVAEMTEADIDALLDFPNVIHHRQKLAAIVAQARGYIEIEREHGSFSKFLWSFVDGQPIDFQYRTPDERITVNETAKQLSKALKQYGFKFIGPVTIFSFMEAAGMYNSHLIDCPHRS
ncbi:DNA-3-methyladenine glycosylase [Staphylococcus microti]|uniref:DNA-3-methyladenine glycosylase n=1 Tax=Staphylococcus microti TaxID=569857 RepID=A0A0D6XPL1_9STAP|nr:DNA-3-methyladenine glycosylase I [Staphylococcus microti]KIX90759.1 DNA-3-methyladenine glycosylase [Staphylococcus microti]PNZ81582.1 DNA-3-methyladenine glycosylase I [Staphylococcus microti]SUM57417.1 DNA-3-methyladenine glycosylase I [Staphylococcus microti]